MPQRQMIKGIIKPFLMSDQTCHADINTIYYIFTCFPSIVYDIHYLL
jgi:hypothetical protein